MKYKIVGGICILVIVGLIIFTLSSAENNTDYITVGEPKIYHYNWYNNMNHFSMNGYISSDIDYPNGLRVSMILYNNEGKQISCYNDTNYEINNISEGFGYAPGSIVQTSNNLLFENHGYNDSFDFQMKTHYEYYIDANCYEFPAYGYIIVTDTEKNTIIHEEYVNMTVIEYT